MTSVSNVSIGAKLAGAAAADARHNERSDSSFINR